MYRQEFIISKVLNDLPDDEDDDNDRREDNDVNLVINKTDYDWEYGVLKDEEKGRVDDVIGDGENANEEKKS